VYDHRRAGLWAQGICYARPGSRKFSYSHGVSWSFLDTKSKGSRRIGAVLVPREMLNECVYCVEKKRSVQIRMILNTRD
jgi:hypothetical protein